MMTLTRTETTLIEFQFTSTICNFQRVGWGYLCPCESQAFPKRPRVSSNTQQLRLLLDGWFFEQNLCQCPSESSILNLWCNIMDYWLGWLGTCKHLACSHTKINIANKPYHNKYLDYKVHFKALNCRNLLTNWCILLNMHYPIVQDKFCQLQDDQFGD